MSDLQPLTKPDVQIAPLKSAGRPPSLDFLPLSKLRVDDSYQRRIERRGLSTIVKICNEFDWSKFAPVIVAPVPGKLKLYAIIDGQHRATAALMHGFDLVPCAIVEAKPQDQPAIFAAINGNVTPITIFQLFKAARAAKADWAVEIDTVCKGGGLVPLVYPKPKSVIKPFETMAIGTLRRNIARFGASEVSAALAAATALPEAAEPGYWNSMAIDYAVAEWRTHKGKRQAAVPAIDFKSRAEKIRELKGRGYTRFAIQQAVGCKLADIEEALRGGA